jgi:hypothetical protein
MIARSKMNRLARHEFQMMLNENRRYAEFKAMVEAKRTDAERRR